MKKRDLIKILESQGCKFVRHGTGHDIYESADGSKKTQIPRHNEINEITAKQIFKQLGVKS